MFVNDSMKGLISTLTGANKELIFLQNINIYSFFLRTLINRIYKCNLFLYQRVVTINFIFFFLLTFG